MGKHLYFFLRRGSSIASILKYNYGLILGRTELKSFFFFVIPDACTNLFLTIF